MNRYEIVSFIPVRASDKMPRKNIEMIAGKPLLAWAIVAGEFFTSQDTIIGIDRIKVGYVMDKWDSILIFNMDDFRVVEFLLNERNKK